MTRSSQKSRDVARKHRVHRKKVEEKAKGIRQAGPAITPPTRTASPAPSRPAAPGPRGPVPAGRPSGPPPAARPARPVRPPERRPGEGPAPRG